MIEVIVLDLDRALRFARGEGELEWVGRGELAVVYAAGLGPVALVAPAQGGRRARVKAVLKCIAEGRGGGRQCIEGAGRALSARCGRPDPPPSGACFCHIYRLFEVRGQEYDPCELKVPDDLRDVRETLRFFGRLIQAVVYSQSLDKDAVAEAACRALEGRDLYCDREKRAYVKPLNDLRRLGILTVGGGDWKRNVAARLTPLGEFIRRLGRGADAVLAGSAPFVLCHSGYAAGSLHVAEAGYCLGLQSAVGDSLLETALASYWRYVKREAAYQLVPYGCPVDKIPLMHSINSSSDFS
ncbi:hypothetical protein [Pyrobaculum islandicum]|uniref:hypothetical protein n=1 Tax=Pyrobaculum islandicum TaxID=2277 RepID=UPI00069F82A6|nr:hypothetical protein [Pyrobaculum islandicum]